MRFWTSDLHLGHSRIIELCHRPFSSVEEMNKTLIDNWNDTVSDDDVVVVCGDVALGALDESLPLMSAMRGRKILVPGNHDRVFSANKPDYVERFRPMYEEHFFIAGENTFTFLDNGAFVKVSHFPYTGDSHDEDRYTEHRPTDDGSLLICGHVHNAWRTIGRQFNVGVDMNDFRPVPETVLCGWVDVLLQDCS